LDRLRSRERPFFEVTVPTTLPPQTPGEPPAYRYKQPGELVRKRIQSEYLNSFMNHSAIENAVEKAKQYEADRAIYKSVVEEQMKSKSKRRSYLGQADQTQETKRASRLGAISPPKKLEKNQLQARKSCRDRGMKNDALLKMVDEYKAL